MCGEENEQKCTRIAGISDLLSPFHYKESLKMVLLGKQFQWQSKN